jgi:hypothetical protein
MALFHMNLVIPIHVLNKHVPGFGNMFLTGAMYVTGVCGGVISQIAWSGVRR